VGGKNGAHGKVLEIGNVRWNGNGLSQNWSIVEQWRFVVLMPVLLGMRCNFRFKNSNWFLIFKKCNVLQSNDSGYS
jgi:hypothetical protein